ncbi:MAG: CpXC domain-containing protein [Treponema sp.]|nr:CpXC domain-containing protein [Treponema sp.]
MQQKITCYCDNVFEVDVPREINLDSNSEYFDQIQNGTFLNFTCQACKKNHKPEFPLVVFWPSRKLCIEVLSELQRGEFYRRKTAPELTGDYDLQNLDIQTFDIQTLIGYPELADRLAVLKSGFEPAAVEAIKYFLHLKAEEQYPDEEIDIWYHYETGGAADNFLHFHIHGLRKNEVAAAKIPRSVYEKTLSDYKNNPKSDRFSALKVLGYLSVKNMMRSDTRTKT